MATELQQATIKIRRDTAANWTSNDPTPLEGEWCLETDGIKSMKVGDGTTAWSSLDYLQTATAWVNFNGTGTPAIRDSFNVSSITDNGGSGDYTINFATAMDNTNYVAVFGGQYGSTAQPNNIMSYSKTTNGLRVRTYNTVWDTLLDYYDISIVLFGGKN